MNIRTVLSENAGARLARAVPDVSPIEKSALMNLPSINRFVGRNTAIAHEAQPQDKLRLFISGWALKSVGLTDDRRQIVGFVLPGNLEGLHTDFRQASVTNVVTLTRCEIAEFSLADILQLAQTYPGIGAALRKYMVGEATVLGDQVLRLGRMTAYERVIHLLLEIFSRQAPCAPDGTTVSFPLTQSILADALGLSVVHVNRQIMRLRQERLLDLDRKSLCIYNFQRLQQISGHRPRLVETAPFYVGAAE